MLQERSTLYAAVAVACALIVGLSPAASADYLTTWTGTVPVLGIVVNPYPEFVAGESCIAQASTVYCVGGLNGTSDPTNLTYAASITGLGVGAWGRLNDYPVDVAGQSCVTDFGYIYCVGGIERSGNSTSASVVTSASYFAPLIGTGIGNWTKTTDYPFNVFDQSCAVFSHTVYCVGGVTSNSSAVPSVEYAQLSPSGIEQWYSAIPYPSSVSASSCVSYVNYMYCVGGLNETFLATASVYYTPLGGRSLDWKLAASYPNPVAGQSCVLNYPGLYCIGGVNATAYATRGVFFSYVNSTQLNWIPSTFYPVTVQSQSCVTYSTYVYCIGGYDGQSFLESVYFSTIGTVQENYAASSSSIVSGSGGTRSSSEATTYAPLVIVLTGAVVIAVISALVSRRRFATGGIPTDELASGVGR